jgi:hypothetical protein
VSRGTLWHALLGMTLMLGTGCVELEPADASLAETTVPEHFRFANTRAITVLVEVADGVLAPEEAAAFVLTNSEGQTLYRGPIFAGGRLELAFPLPSTDERLAGTLTTHATTMRAEAPISEGSAVLRFE